MDYMEILQRHDDPVHWMEEPGFDYEASLERVKKFCDELSNALRVTLKLETGALLQDAIYHSELFIPSEATPEASIRFSSFGNLVTIKYPEYLPIEQLNLIIDLFRVYGYVYVPLQVLTHPYTGRNPGIDGFPDWYSRFFGC